MSDLPELQPGRPDHVEGKPGLVVKTSGFAISSEVADVARQLIDRHDFLAFVDGYDVVYLMDHSELPLGGKYCDMAKARLVPPWVRALFEADAAISVNVHAWQILNPTRREALVLHELLHLGQNDKGALVIVPHDVEEFGRVAALYGPWRNALDVFGQQLQLGLERRNGPAVG